VLVRPAPTALLHETSTSEEIASRARRWQLQLWMAWFQPVEELSRTPLRVLSPRLADHARNIVADLVRASVRGSAAICQTSSPFLFEALQPLVSRLPADAVPLTQLLHLVEAQTVVLDELFSLFHW
jgi:hypothetical protein